MISVAEARARILAPLSPVGTELVALNEAWNRVLARPVVARLNQPPADMSAMDGFALRAADGFLGARLPVAGSAPAGRLYGDVVPQGAAIRLFTGSVMPQGADCVVIQEHVTRAGDVITVHEAAVQGRHVRPAGQDFRHGAAVLNPGRRLTARDVGLAAAANHPWLTVHRAPRVALLATGDELVLPGEPMAAGGIVGSNTYALAALIRAAGGIAVLLPIVPDDREAIAAIAREAAGCDLIVTIGGASVGDHDLVHAALAPHGLTLDFWKIAMRPGKPLMFGVLGSMPMLGLPGNPVSALVCATLFLWPALQRLGGETAARPLLERAQLDAPLPANDVREEFLRAVMAGEANGPRVRALADQASSLQHVLAQADALIVRPPYAPPALVDDWLPIIRFGALGI